MVLFVIYSLYIHLWVGFFLFEHYIILMPDNDENPCMKDSVQKTF
jgi:hypothetical protein